MQGFDKIPPVVSEEMRTRRQIWVCSVSLCPFYGTLGTYGLIQLDFIASPGITDMFFPKNQPTRFI